MGRARARGVLVRLVDNGSGQLTLTTRANPWLVVLGSLLVVVGTAAAILPGKARELVMQRWDPDDGVIELVEHNLLGSWQQVRIPLFMVKGAEVVPGMIGGKPRFWRLNLDVRDGEGIFYITWYGNKAKADADAAVVNAFLREPGRLQARIVNDKRPWAFGFGGLSAALGLVFLLWGSQRLRVAFDRERSQVVVERSGWLGTTSERFPLASMTGVRVAGIMGDGLMYAVLQGGREVALTNSTDPEAYAGPKRVRAARHADAITIRAFAGLQVESAAEGPAAPSPLA